MPVNLKRQGGCETHQVTIPHVLFFKARWAPLGSFLNLKPLTWLWHFKLIKLRTRDNLCRRRRRKKDNISCLLISPPYPNKLCLSPWAITHIAGLDKYDPRRHTNARRAGKNTHVYIRMPIPHVRKLKDTHVSRLRSRMRAPRGPTHWDRSLLMVVMGTKSRLLLKEKKDKTQRAAIVGRGVS